MYTRYRLTSSPASDRRTGHGRTNILKHVAQEMAHDGDGVCKVVRRCSGAHSLSQWRAVERAQESLPAHLCGCVVELQFVLHVMCKGDTRDTQG